jgi:hypothetical protein
MIDNHIETLKAKASGIEKRLCETKEDLPAEKIISLCKELNETISIINYLHQIKSVREKSPIIQPNKKIQIVQ